MWTVLTLVLISLVSYFFGYERGYKQSDADAVYEDDIVPQGETPKEPIEYSYMMNFYNAAVFVVLLALTIGAGFAISKGLIYFINLIAK